MSDVLGRNVMAGNVPILFKGSVALNVEVIVCLKEGDILTRQHLNKAVKSVHVLRVVLIVYQLDAYLWHVNIPSLTAAVVCVQIVSIMDRNTETQRDSQIKMIHVMNAYVR